MKNLLLLLLIVPVFLSAQVYTTEQNQYYDTRTEKVLVTLGKNVAGVSQYDFVQIKVFSKNAGEYLVFDTQLQQKKTAETYLPVGGYEVHYIVLKNMKYEWLNYNLWITKSTTTSLNVKEKAIEIYPTKVNKGEFICITMPVNAYIFNMEGRLVDFYINQDTIVAPEISGTYLIKINNKTTKIVVL